MADTEIKRGDPGVASFETESFGQVEVILSDTPTYFDMAMVSAASQSLEIYTVVGVNGSGEIIPAVSGTTEAIGVTASKIEAGVGENPSVPIIRGGHLNANALVWDASYNTDALKKAAFDAAPQPTQIVIGTNPWDESFA